MLTSILVIGVSVALFCYWFRYICLLVLDSGAACVHARKTAEANHLHYIQNRSLIAHADSVRMKKIYNSLNRDFEIVQILVRGLAFDTGRVEVLLLRLDFHLLRCWYRFAAIFHQGLAKIALLEMTRIVEHFSECFGRSACAAD